MPAKKDGRASAIAGTTGAPDTAADTTGKRPRGVRSSTGSSACDGAGSHDVPDTLGAATDTASNAAPESGPAQVGPSPAARPKAGLPIPHPRATDAIVRAAAATNAAAPAMRAVPPYRVLVVQDGATDIELIEALVADSSPHVELHRAYGIDEATALLFPAPGGVRRSARNGSFNCLLLDLAASAEPAESGEPGELGEPEVGSDGLDGLRELLRRAPNTAVVVLTDATGAELGAAAVAAGAQDFLIKQETDGPLLARALRYAVERKRADESQRRLVEAELRGQENARLQRHLLPTPLLDGANLSFTRRYRPGRRRALLGGDFYDAVRTADGAVHVVIGDVCGHGPDEAALGVALRIAWRTLVFAGLTGQKLLTTLQHVLEHERRSDEIFATLCMLVIVPEQADPTGDVVAAERAELYLAGHPAPLLLSPDGSSALLATDQAGPALGLLPCDDHLAAWPAQRLELPAGWRVMLYTDGLIEGRIGAGSRRLGQDGLLELIADHQAMGLTRGRLVDSAIAEVEELNGGALADDVAVLLLERSRPQVMLG